MELINMQKQAGKGLVTMSSKGQLIFKGNYYNLKVCEECGKVGLMQGINKYCSRSCAQIGEKNGMYNKDLTDEHREKGRATPDYYQWKLAVLERDKKICQFCGSQHDIGTHHIRAYSLFPRWRTRIDNGITWCKTCHKNFHHRFGYHNSVREFKAFMKDSPLQYALSGDF